MRNQNKKGNPLVGCLVLILFGVIGVWAVWLAPKNTKAPYTPSAITPYPTVEFVWTRGAYEFDSATTETRADLRICPELRCDVVTSVGAGASLEIASIVLGGAVDGEYGWFEIRRDDQLLYVPVAHVFAETVTRMAMTASVIDVDDEMVAMPADVVFYQCQQLSCAEAGTISQGQRILITKMVAGEMVEGIQLWVMAVDGDGNEAYAPSVYVFPRPTPTPEATNEK
ncbi:MAG: hypothetical protein SFZ02_19095 [bacterium]|nr:hypothetical protein [bacterium]